MMAAASAAFLGKEVLLIEKNEKLGKKMYITGKGRCNITNDCPADEFFNNVPRNPKFLMSCIYALPPEELMDMLHRQGLKTKTERGRRVFPESDKSSDVIRCMIKILDAAGVCVRLCSKVIKIEKKEGIFAVHMEGEKPLFSKVVIVATGGASYPQTGSTGDGYGFAQSFGHTVFKAYPALVPLLEEGDTCAQLAGLALKNVTFTLRQNKKIVFSELGEMLFTHGGVSGPLVLSASSLIDYSKPFRLTAEIDLKPALTVEKLDKRILRDFEQYKNKHIDNAMNQLLPQRLIAIVLKLAGIPAEKSVNSVTKPERENLIKILKAFPLQIRDTAGLEEAIITRGGIDVRDINPSTLQSRKTGGLYFAGEVIDVDALTGGYNMQIAFSTGWLAGMAAAEHLS